MQVFDKDIPQEWLGVLSSIQRVCPGAVLAGGCLRDLVWGGEVKDLDVFVPWELKDYELLWNARQIGWRDGLHLAAEGYRCIGTCREEVKAIQNFSVPGLTPNVQVVHIDMEPFNSLRVIERMDFAPCQIAFDGEHLNISAVARRDLSNRTFTLVRCENSTQARRSIRRAERFRDRYPSHTFDLSLAQQVLEAV